MYLFNAFSLNMVSGSGSLNYKEISQNEAREILSHGFESAIGHQDMANLLTSVLNTTVPFNRANNSLVSGDQFIVAQYKGPRLPEGCISLPNGAVITFFLCSIE